MPLRAHVSTAALHAVLLVPIAYTIAAKYAITNEALIGALCIPVGLGNIVGSTFAGRLSDRLVVRARAARGGVWVPEDRLRATVAGGLVCAPLSILASGAVTQWCAATRGWMGVNFVCLFVNGFGVSVLFNPSNAYLVDILHARSAEVTAANMAARNAVTALAVGGILPALQRWGVAATFAGAAGVAWVGFALTTAVLVWGAPMRKWVDLGFSTAEDN